MKSATDKDVAEALTPDRGGQSSLSTFGYFKKHFLMTSREVAEMRELILAHARAHGRTLDALYIDEIETAPRELYECLADSGRSEDKVLIVPSLLHLAGEGDPRRLRQHLESCGFVVLIAQPKQAEQTY